MQGIERRNRELTILNTVAAALNQEVNLRNALQRVLASAADMLNLKTGWVWLTDDNGAYYLAAAQNLPPVIEQNPELMSGSCYCLDTYREGNLEGAANVNVVECSRLFDLLSGTDGLRYHASIPLYSQDRARKVGVLNVASPHWRGLDPYDLRLLQTIGDLLSMAIERAQLFEQSTQYGIVEERNRLAREIHDTLAQGLTAIALQLETADALLDTDAPDLAQLRWIVKRGLTLTRSNLEEVRRSVMDLRAASLENRALADALADLTMGIAPPPTVNFAVVGDAQPLNRRIEAGLYRMASEALANAVKHAQANTLHVQLLFLPQSVQLSIEDDGTGFDPSTILDAPEGRFGLIGLRERAKLLGGSLLIESDPGAGTRILIQVNT